jgi:hypothetical protein
MADTANIVVAVEQNGYRNVIIRASLVSDGSGLTNYKLYDASSAGAFGVTAPGGQIVYPGVHSTLVGLDYDVQDMKINLLWDASPTPQSIWALGAAPEDFNWTRFGGIRCPAATLAGATGSIDVTTINAAPNSTFAILLYIRKNVPVS